MIYSFKFVDELGTAVHSPTGRAGRGRGREALENAIGFIESAGLNGLIIQPWV